MAFWVGWRWRGIAVLLTPVVNAEQCFCAMQEIRKLIISAILATDMSFHFSLTTEFKNHAGMMTCVPLLGTLPSAVAAVLPVSVCWARWLSYLA